MTTLIGPMRFSLLAMSLTGAASRPRMAPWLALVTLAMALLLMLVVAGHAAAAGPCIAITFGDTLSGTIGVATEEDCFTFSGSVGDRVRVGVVKTSGSWSPVIEIARPNGTILCSTLASILDCTLDASGEPDRSASSISGVRLSALDPVLNLPTEAAGQPPIVGGQGAATNLVARVECAQAVPGQALAHLAWTITSAGSEQRVDVTIFPNGFAAGHYESFGPLPPNQSSLTLDQLKGQAVHQWRVLTLRGGAWIASKTAQFEGPTCVRDVPR